MTNEESVCHRAFSAIVNDVEALSLYSAEMRRTGGEVVKSNFTSDILSANEPADVLDIFRNAQKIINKRHQLLLLTKGLQISVHVQDH